MSKNAKKQTGRQQQPSKKSTQSEPKHDESKTNDESQPTPTTSDATTGNDVQAQPPGDETSTTSQSTPDAEQSDEAITSEGTTAGGPEQAAEGDDSDTDDQTPDDDVEEPENDEDEPEQPRQANDDPQSKPVDANTAKMTWAPLPPEGKPEGRILKADDEPVFDGERVGENVLVKEDVYREVYPRGAQNPTYVLLFRKGTLVPNTAVQGTASE